MNQLPISIRNGTREDYKTLQLLYQQVAEKSGGIARDETEISDQYIINIIDKATKDGLILVAVDDHLKIVIGCIHASKPGIKMFNHVLNDLTILVHPSYQNMGLGRELFRQFLSKVQTDFPEVLRVELFCRVSNQKALILYEKLGFRREGRFEKRVMDKNGMAESDIPMAWFNPSYQLPKRRSQNANARNFDWIPG